MKRLYKLLFNTSQQKVLAFLAENAGDEYQEKEIVKHSGVKKSMVNLVLHELAEEKIIDRRQIGRSSLYSANRKSNIIKEVKILQNILEIESLVYDLKRESQKVVLFGSSANGTNTKESDIDLFVLTNKSAEIRKIISSSSLEEKIQLIIKSPAEMLKINKKKPLLFQEIEKGKILWEVNEDEGI
ncbi:MAG: nucleotidyltransferase domain-containing protein [Candidatus Moranbacteria bacterium]|nr:nucleotidyltransferase domain-containing protein [Candidatus Moranbacteria bacterium]